jgi:hypothetical protein
MNPIPLKLKNPLISEIKRFFNFGPDKIIENAPYSIASFVASFFQKKDAF